VTNNGRARVLSLYWGRKGGGGRYAYAMTAALAEVYGDRLTASFSRQSEHAAAFATLPTDIHWLDTYTSPAHFAAATLALPAKLASLRRFIRERQVNVVYCSMSQPWWPAVATMCRRMGVRVVFTCHDATPHPGEGGRLRQHLMNWEVRNADAVIVLTEHVRGQVVAAGVREDRVTVLPLGVFDYDPAGAHRSTKCGVPRRLLFFGRILPYKGLPLLIDAFAELQREIPDLCLEIAGSGDLGASGERIAALPNVTLMQRWIPESEVPAIFARNDLLVTPYVEASQSGPVATAFAFGMPVITTPVGGLLEQVRDGENGWVAEGVSASALAAAIRRAVASANDYARMSAAAREHADRELAWPVLARGLAQVCDRLSMAGPR
jgi:glycosyltransferase involved in cell wall biosynthesis